MHVGQNKILKNALEKMQLLKDLKLYYDQKITFIFSSDFETLAFNYFRKKTVYLNCNFLI